MPGFPGENYTCYPRYYPQVLLVKNSDVSHRPILPIFLFVTVFAAVLAIVVGNDLVSNDGAQYLSTANNFINGKGLSTSVLYYDQHFESGSLPAPQAMWPPAYPILVSFIAFFTNHVDLVTIIINLVLYGVSGWLLYGLILRVGASDRAALGCLLVYFLVAQGWINALEVRTEPLFALVSLAVFRYLPERTYDSGLNWFLVGAGTGLATATRYVGIVELLAVLLLLFTSGVYYLLRRNTEYFFKVFFNGLFATVGACLFLVPVLARNYLLSGSITPRSGQDEALTLLATIDNFVYALAGLFGFSAHGSLPNSVRYLVFIVLLLSLIALIAIQCLRLGNRSKINAIVQLSIWCTLLSFGLFVWSGLTTSPTNLNVRYLYSWILLALPALCWLIAAGQPVTRFSRLTLAERTRNLMAVIVLSIFIFGQVDFLFSKRHQLSDIAYLKQSIAENTSVGGTVRELALQCAASGGSLLSNRSQQLHRLLRVPTIGMAKSHYTSIRFDSQYMTKVVDQYQVSFVVLYKKKFSARVNSDDEVQRLDQIISKLQDSKNFQNVYDDGLTYAFRNTDVCGESS